MTSSTWSRRIFRLSTARVAWMGEMVVTPAMSLPHVLPAALSSGTFISRNLVLQWILFLMFETLNSCWRKVVCAKIMPNVGKKSFVVCPPPQFQQESEKEARFLANLLSSRYLSFAKITSFPFSGIKSAKESTSWKFPVDPTTTRFYKIKQSFA